MHSKPRRLWIALLIVLWMGFALRVAGIDRQSIWYDEGLSIFYARGSLTEVLTGISESEHPPLHSLLLHFWMAVCGDSELAVRMMSAWWGVAAVAWTYRLGKRLSPVVGGLAALLLAVSPFAIWFSQETRGYTLALALTVGAVDAALHVFPAFGGAPEGQRAAKASWYGAYVLLSTAALYAHTYSAFVLLSLNLVFALQQAWAARRLRRSYSVDALVAWAGAQLAVLALFAPWVPFVANQLATNATYWHGAVGWRQIVRQTVIAFSVGKTLEGAWAVLATWALLLLSLLGTSALGQRRSDRAWLTLLWLWVIVPVASQILINRSLPKFAPRYTMNAMPAFLLLASAGLAWLYETARQYAFKIPGWLATMAIIAATATVGGATARSLGNHYLDTRLYRPDFRTVAAYVDAHATPEDLIVLVAGHSYPAFTYYYRGPLPVVPLPDSMLPTTRAPIDLEALKTLDLALPGRKQLWLVLWQDTLADPTGLITDELEHTYHRLGIGRTFHDVGLLLFDVSPGPLLTETPMPQVALSADLGDQVRLLGYDLPVQTLRPGETLYLYLYWQALVPIEHDYKVFTQVLDGSDRVIAQHDKIAGAAEYPTSHWLTGATVRDRFMLTVRPGTAPGRYALIAGMYRPSPKMPRLLVRGEGARGDHVLISEIHVR